MTPPRTSRPDQVLGLQRSLGNRATLRVLTSVQRIVELPNDKVQGVITAVTQFLVAARTAYAASLNGVPIPQVVTDEYAAWEDLLNHAQTQPGDPTTLQAFLAGGPAPQAAGYAQASGRIPAGTTFLNSPELFQHIGNLVSAADTALTGGFGSMGEDLGRQEGPATSQCLGAGALTGLTFQGIDGAARGAPNFKSFKNFEIGRDDARSRLEWLFNDGSFIAIDVPGKGVKEAFRVSTLPHAEKRAATGYEHLSDTGVVVPAASQPAHIGFDWKHYSLRTHLEANGGALPRY